MSVESKPNRLTKGLVLDTFHTDVDNTVATYALNSQLEDQEGNHFHYGSEVGTNHIKDIPDNHVVIGHINMERNETVLFTTDGTNSTIGILSRNDDMSYNYEIKVDDTDQKKKLNFKKNGYVRGVYRLLNGCDKVIYFVDGVNKDRRVNFNKLDSYKDPASTASGIIFDDSLKATIYALSSATGNIQLIRLMSASPEATANVLATLTSGAELTKLLTASANGIGTALANLTRTANMIISTNATGTSTANVDIVRLLQSNVSAIGSINAILESSQAGVVEIDVTLTGVASSTAILLRTAILEANLTTEASVVVEAILTRIINAQVQATADTSATAQLTVPVNATANATATTAADAILSYAVNATANAMAETSATAQLSKVITASVDAVANSSVEALIGLVLVSTTTANGSVSTADLYINRLLTSSVTAQGTTTAEALIAKLLQSSVTSTATATSDVLVSKLASSSITAQATTTADSLISKLLASTVSATGTVTANLQLADLLSTTVNGTATTEAVLEAINLLIGDPYIDNVSLLLQGDDNPSGVTQNNTFIDSSTNNFTITRNGNVTQGTFSPFDRALTNSGGSAYFDGTGDYLTVAANSAFSFNSDFTIECWINATSLSTGISLFIINIGNGTYFALNPGTSSIDIYLNSVTPSFNATCTISLNTWTHIALVRSSNIVRVYINGVVLTNTVTNSSTLGSSTNPLVVCGLTGAFNGYISNLRVVKGTAVYTSNFQPSTIPLTAITNTSLLLNFTNAAIFDGVKLNNIETVGNAQINTSIKKYGTGSLAFDGTGDYLTIPINSNLEFGTGDFTVETWIRFNIITLDIWIVGIGQGFVGSGALLTIGWFVRYTANTLSFVRYDGTTQTEITRSWTPVINTWYHIAISRSGTSLRFYVDGNQLGTTQTNSTSYNKVNNDNLQIGLARTGYAGTSYNYLNGYIDDLRITKGIARYTSNFNTNLPGKLSSLIPNYLVSRSLRFNSADLTYLSRTPTVAGNRKTWTWSGWVKRGTLGTYQALFGQGTGTTASGYGFIRFDNNDVITILASPDGAVSSIVWTSTPVYRDLSAWYHIVAVLDTTQATAANRFILYVNGVSQTGSFSTTPISNANIEINRAAAHQIGVANAGSLASYFNGYMTEVNFIDGQALTPDSFGIRNTSTGVWSPKEYTGTYGINGFHLNFSDITQIGRDFSGNNNNWTPSGFSVTPGVGYDSLTDVPTPNGTDNGFGGEVRGNYATWNPTASGTGATLTNGNLDYSLTGAADINRQARGTFLIPTSGKWYWETLITLVGELAIGVINIQNNLFSYYYRYDIGGWQNIYINSVQTAAVVGFTTNDVIGVGYDSDNQQIRFYKNGVQVGTNYSLLNTKNLVPYINHGSGAGSSAGSTNFGQRPFTYQAPTGFKALNTANLPTPAIGGGGESNLANKYMDITTYTGTGAAQSIFNSGFKPDFVWIKSRSVATNHLLYDINRGVTKHISSDSTNAEVTNANGLTSFDNTGFSLGSFGDANLSGATYIAWQWRAGGTPVTNNGGATPSQVSVSQISGFSVVSYTGTSSATTIGHGLGVAPKMIIIKNVNNIATWAIYHDSLGSGSPQTYYLDFSNNLQSISTAYWNSIKPTVNNFSIGVGTSSVNGSGNPFIAYCFAEIEGYSKFSSYLGNNSTNGTFVYTGFKPKYILIKCITAAGNWVLYNSIVNTGNPVINELFANTTAAENSVANDDIDFLSNGFKLRSTNAAINAAQTYIYAAFAETPFKYATAALTPELKETISVDYLVVAGGGGGGTVIGGGGGAGGYRTGTQVFAINTNYTVTVGAGGASSVAGSNSVFSSITSAGGGAGATYNVNGNSGGSGSGGGGGFGVGGAGNTPSTSPSQGNNGGNGFLTGSFNTQGGGGGGAGAVGGNASSSTAGNGGAGAASSITGSSVTRAGGGGGGNETQTAGGSGGSGGGGAGGRYSPNVNGTNGTVNTGGGGGGGGTTGGAGGSGVVIIRATIQAASTTGSPTYTTSGSYHIYQFNGDGSITY